MSSDEKISIIITYSHQDYKFAKFITDGLNRAGINTVCSDLDSGKLVNGVDKNEIIVQSNIFILILSQYSTRNERLLDEVALAYVSDKPIFPISVVNFYQLSKKLDSALKLMLAKINWTLFISEKNEIEDKFYPLLDELIEQIKIKLSNLSVNIDDTIKKKNAKCDEFEAYRRLNSQKSIILPSTETNSDINTDFWRDNFDDKTCINLSEFISVFQSKYGESIKEKYDSDMVDWFCNLLKEDVFENERIIKYESYCKFIGDDGEFYDRLNDYASGMLAMKEVLDMNSSVRFTAIDKLTTFHTNCVTMAMLGLTKDDDPNIRAVSALGLVKSGKTDDWIGRRLIEMLSDSDRLVRESACLSIGHMRYYDGVDSIIYIWRNDPIKHVREAAQLALTRIGGDKAKEAMKLVTILTQEINSL